MSVRVFVIEGHELVRRGLVDLLRSAQDLLVVGAAADAEEALPLIARSQPQVVLVDALLTDGARLAVGRRIGSEHPEVRCVLLTSFDDDEALFTAVMAGSAGYLVKQVGGTRLLDGVRTVAAGHSLLDTAVTERLLDRLRCSGQGDHRGTSLDEHEQQVLDLVGRGHTDGQIAEKLDSSVTEVQAWVTAIYAKLTPGGGGSPVPPEHGPSTGPS